MAENAVQSREQIAPPRNKWAEKDLHTAIVEAKAKLNGKPYVRIPEVPIENGMEYLADLVARDTEMPLKKGSSSTLTWDECPSCGRVAIPCYEKFHFCPYCGQRIDYQNYAFE